MKAIKRELLIEEIKGNKEVAYALLEARHPLFVDEQLTIGEETLILESHLNAEMYDWQKVTELTSDEKIRHLINIGQLFEELKYSKYTYQLSPWYLVFTVNGLPQLTHRGIKDQVPPYEHISEKTFLMAYQAMIIALLDNKVSYDMLMEGKLTFYKGNLFCEAVLETETVADILTLLHEKYLHEKENSQEQYTRVKKRHLAQWKTATVIATLTAIFSLVGILYLLLSVVPHQTTISTLRLAFIQEDYSKVLTTVKNQESKSLSQEDKYIVAYSVIMSEPLTLEQKKALSRISPQSNEAYLRYWILIGQAQIDEAIDIASFLDDPQLLMYGMTKKIDDIQRDPNLKSEERTEKINSYKTKLEELKKKYLNTSSDSNSSTTTDKPNAPTTKAKGGQ